jgi:hypothetical protein
MRTVLLIAGATLVARAGAPVSATWRRERAAAMPHRCPPRPAAGASGRRAGTPGFRALATAGLAALYLAACLGALALLAGFWRLAG